MNYGPGSLTTKRWGLVQCLKEECFAKGIESLIPSEVLLYCFWTQTRCYYRINAKVLDKSSTSAELRRVAGVRAMEVEEGARTTGLHSREAYALC